MSVNLHPDVLTSASLNAYKPSSKQYIIHDPTVPKLKIRIEISGTKTFYVYFRNQAGTERKYKIGRVGDISLGDARKIASQILAKVALGDDPTVARYAGREEGKRDEQGKLRHFLDTHYYPWAAMSQKRPYVNKGFIERNFAWLMDRQMSSITRAEFEKWQDSIFSKGIKPSSINRYASLLTSILNHAVQAGIIASNPLSNRRRIRVDNANVIRWMSDEEGHKLFKNLEHIDDAWFRLLIHILYNTGMRPIEALTLDWKRVNLELKLIEVSAAFSKTGKFRAIPINDQLLDILTSIDEKEGNVIRYPQDVSLTSVHKRVLHRWHLLVDMCGISNLRLYDLRHNFASKLVMSGIDLYTVSQLLGHTDVKTTQVYAHLSPEHLQGAVNMMPKIRLMP